MAMACGLGLLSLPALASTEEHLTKQFGAKPGGQLVVDVDLGSVEVSTNAGDKVDIDVWRKVGRSKKSDEEKYLKDHPVEFSQDGDTVTVKCRRKGGWSSGWSENDARYTITVPARFDARVGTSGGGILVNDLDGKVKAQTSAGGLNFNRLHGPLDGQTSGGGIDSRDCEGDLRLETSAGGVKVSGGAGKLKADTSGGGIHVEHFKGPSALQTSAGEITLDDVTGEIRGQTSGGGIKADLPSISGPIHLDTSAGGITLRLPANAAFDLDAATSAGSVNSDLPVTVTGKQQHDSLKGTVNGGGPSVSLRSSAGSIHLRKSDPALAEDPK